MKCKKSYTGFRSDLLTSAAFVVLIATAPVSSVSAAPENGVVVAGNASVKATGKITTITQSTDKAIQSVSQIEKNNLRQTYRLVFLGRDDTD